MYLHTAEMSGTLHRVAIFPANYIWWKYYGLASAARPVIGVLESGSEIRCIIENTRGGLCCEPGEYDKVEENLRWFIDNAGSEELKAMGARGRENLEKNLTRSVSVQKYEEEMLKL